MEIVELALIMFIIKGPFCAAGIFRVDFATLRMTFDIDTMHIWKYKYVYQQYQLCGENFLSRCFHGNSYLQTDNKINRNDVSLYRRSFQ